MSPSRPKHPSCATPRDRLGAISPSPQQIHPGSLPASLHSAQLYFLHRQEPPCIKISGNHPSSILSILSIRPLLPFALLYYYSTTQRIFPRNMHRAKRRLLTAKSLKSISNCYPTSSPPEYHDRIATVHSSVARLAMMLFSCHPDYRRVSSALHRTQHFSTAIHGVALSCCNTNSSKSPVPYCSAVPRNQNVSL